MDYNLETELRKILRLMALTLFAAIFVFMLLLMAGCETSETQPKSGNLEYTRTGDTEKLVVNAPEADEKGSSVTYALNEGQLTVTFGGQHRPAQPQGEGDKWGQYIFYGCGAVCLLVGMGLIGIGKHFKLGTIAFVAAGACIGIAVTISKFAWIWGYLVGAGVIALLAFMGWNLWSDYKSRPKNSDPRIWIGAQGGTADA